MKTTQTRRPGAMNSSRINPAANLERARRVVAGAKLISDMSLPDDIEDFSVRLQRSSPYKELIDTLRSAGAGKIAVIEEVKAKGAIAARAKKIGLTAEFAIHGDKLYVRLADDRTTTPAPKGAAVRPEAAAARR